MGSSHLHNILKFIKSVKEKARDLKRTFSIMVDISGQARARIIDCLAERDDKVQTRSVVRIGDQDETVTRRRAFENSLLHQPPHNRGT